MYTRIVVAFFLGVFILPLLSVGTGFALAQTEIKKLQGEITQRNDKLSEIEKEILEYEAALREVGAEKSTLQSTINRLTLERKKVLADLNYTDTKINSTDLEIDKLTLEIQTTEDSIIQN